MRPCISMKLFPGEYSLNAATVIAPPELEAGIRRPGKGSRLSGAEWRWKGWGRARMEDKPWPLFWGLILGLFHFRQA